MKTDFNHKVPEYLRELAESGIDVDQVFKLPTIDFDTQEDVEEKAEKYVGNARTLKKTIKKLEQSAADKVNGNHHSFETRGRDDDQIQKMVDEKKEKLRRSIKHLNDMISSA